MSTIYLKYTSYKLHINVVKIGENLNFSNTDWNVSRVLSSNSSAVVEETLLNLHLSDRAGLVISSIVKCPNITLFEKVRV